MGNQLIFNKDSLWKTGLDRLLGFAIFIIVKPTALSVRRDGGFF